MECLRVFPTLDRSRIRTRVRARSLVSIDSFNWSLRKLLVVMRRLRDPHDGHGRSDERVFVSVTVEVERVKAQPIVSI
jgi:hypothetical protein